MNWPTLKASCEVALAAAGVDRPARMVLDWFSDVYGRASLKDEAVPSKNVETVHTQLQRLIAGEPLAYVTGLAHFYGYELEVGPGVLIPRPETEELVRWILEDFPMHPAIRFADLCCGSGCIGVALVLRRLTWSGIACDLSPYAIEFTERNAKKHDVTTQLEVNQVDLFSKGQLSVLPELDLIVSNPPYIGADDWSRVAPNVADFEPRMALFVEGSDPLLFYRRLERLARHRLRSAGWLYVECNDRLAQRVADELIQLSWRSVEVLTDMQGKPRHVKAMKPAA